ADAHSVLPVAIERGDRDLAFLERVGPLAEARATPGLADLRADRPQHRGDRFAAQPRLRVLDVALHTAGAGEDHELFWRFFEATLAAGADHQCRLEQVVIAAVGAGADEGLIERQLLEGHFVG